MALQAPRAAVRRPHRRHRQRVPPPRGRDRPVGADRRRAAGPRLGPRGVPPGRRPEDGEVRRQHRADRRRRRARHRPARVPLPRADLALPPQARVHAASRSPAAAAGLDSLRERLRRLGPPPADGPWAGPAAAPRGRRAGPADRARPRASRGHGGGRRRPADRPRPRAARAPLAATAAPSTTGSSTALDDDLDLPTALAVVREAVRAPTCPTTSGAGSRSTPTSCSAWTSTGRGRRPHEAADGTAPAEILALLEERDGGARRRATSPAPTSCGRDSPRTGWEVVDGPDGSVVRRASLTGRDPQRRDRSRGPTIGHRLRGEVRVERPRRGRLGASGERQRSRERAGAAPAGQAGDRGH